jgi:signal transduction histidine kinase
VDLDAARHGEEPIELSISLEDAGLRVAVLDHGQGFDPSAISSGWPRHR